MMNSPSDEGADRAEQARKAREAVEAIGLDTLKELIGEAAEVASSAEFDSATDPSDEPYYWLERDALSRDDYSAAMVEVTRAVLSVHPREPAVVDLVTRPRAVVDSPPPLFDDLARRSADADADDSVSGDLPATQANIEAVLAAYDSFVETVFLDADGVAIVRRHDSTIFGFYLPDAVLTRLAERLDATTQRALRTNGGVPPTG